MGPVQALEFGKDLDVPQSCLNGVEFENE